MALILAALVLFAVGSILFPGVMDWAATQQRAFQNEMAAAVRAILATGVDYAFDTTGRQDILTATMTCLAPKGVLGIVGIPAPGTPMPGDLGTVLTFGQTVRGIIEGDSDPDVFIPELIAHWRAGRLPLEKLVKTFPFAQINQAIAAQHHGDCVKVVLILPDA